MFLLCKYFLESVSEIFHTFAIEPFFARFLTSGVLMTSKVWKLYIKDFRKTASWKDPPQVFLDWATVPKEKAWQQSAAIVFQSSAVHVLVRVFNFRLNFSPKTSLNIPSLHIVLSLKLIKTCVVTGVSRDVCEFFSGLKRLLLGKESSWRFIRPQALKK